MRLLLLAILLLALPASAQTQGTLAAGDNQLSSGEYADDYTFTVEDGQMVTVTLDSDEFDPYLILQPPTDEQIDNDDWEGSTSRSRIEVAAAEGGTWRVLVTSYEPGESGSYTLTIEVHWPISATADAFMDDDEEPVDTGRALDQVAALNASADLGSALDAFNTRLHADPMHAQRYLGYDEELGTLEYVDGVASTTLLIYADAVEAVRDEVNTMLRCIEAEPCLTLYDLSASSSTDHEAWAVFEGFENDQPAATELARLLDAVLQAARAANQ